METETTVSWKNCPVNILAMATKPCKGTVSGTATCALCGHAKCPICGRHNVTQLSRVTGYIQSVEGWNEAKKQELKDRQRTNIGIGGSTTQVKKYKEKEFENMLNGIRLDKMKAKRHGELMYIKQVQCCNCKQCIKLKGIRGICNDQNAKFNIMNIEKFHECKQFKGIL